MPHLFVNRPRQLDLGRRHPSLRNNFRWETANTVVYLAGGVMFVWGSVLFFPAMATRANRGAWVFFIASLMYVAVTGHDFLEVVRRRASLPRPLAIWDRFEAWAGISYLVGSVLFAVGSVFFMSGVGRFDAGALCFVIGSLLFVCGAVVNVLQVVRAPDLRILQFMNLTAITFVTGSALFLVASIPYLFNLQSASAERTIDAFLASQYVVGSVLFLLGGWFNYRRAGIVAHSDAQSRDGGHPAVLPSDGAI